MSDGDWRDPFAEDEAARERERRRAEREARRREQRRKLADKVREEAGEREAVPAQAESKPISPGLTQMPPARSPDPEPAPPSGAGRATQPAAVPSPDTHETFEASDRAVPAGSDLEADPATAIHAVTEAQPRRRPVAPQSDHLTEDAGEGGDEPPGPPRGPGRGPGAKPPRDVLVRRRIMAIGLLAIAAAAVALGAGPVIDALSGSGSSGGEQPEQAAAPTTSVTIPEGLDRRQIAAIAEDAGLGGNYMRASREARGFNSRQFGAGGAENLEGFLFPATYELERGGHVNGLVQRQLDAFRDQIGGVNMRQAESRNLSVYDVLKIASMIEREVQIPRERKLVSAVIYNRLANGSPLAIDATIRYEDRNYDEPLTESRLAEPTPYNTRINVGLPPTPIGNPGLASIEAAARPADVDHLYYVVKPNTCGEHFFTNSAEEFESAAAEYQQALEEAGGAPTPENC